MPKVYDNTNRGVLFKNDDKKSDNHPDYKGQLDVGGTEFWLSAWIKKPKEGGAKFMSLSITEKQAKPRAQPPVKQSNIRDVDDDTPF